MTHPTELGTPAREALGDRDVHVWLAEPGTLHEEGRLAVCRALLDEEERRRGERLRADAAGRRFVVGHALVRRTLSRYADVPAEAWRFRTGAHGKPAVAGPPEGSDLCFNLSHTAGLAACAVSRGLELGVDVERGDRVRRPEALARRFFAPGEAVEIAGLAGAARRARFVALWTLKEAYVKARGRGLSLPLRAFRFEGEAGTPEIVFERDLGDRPEHWHFTLQERASGHALALAVRRPEGEEASLALSFRHDEALCER